MDGLIPSELPSALPQLSIPWEALPRVHFLAGGRTGLRVHYGRVY